MAPCKWQVKATRHLICSRYRNWVDFVKSGCEKSWAEVQADNFSFECRGCTRMKELGGTVDDKVGEDDKRCARESSSQPGRRLRRGKVVGTQDVRRWDIRGQDVGRQDERRREGKKWEGRQMD